MTGSGTREVTLSVHLIRSLLAYAAKRGIESQEIIEQAGLEPHLLGDLEARIPARVFGGIWDATSARLADEDFGLHFGADADFLHGGHVLHSMMLNCPTLGDAVDRFCRYHGLMADSVTPELRIQDNRAAIALRLIYPDLVLDRHHAEAVLATIISLLGRLVDGGVPLLEVQFTHPEPSSALNVQRFFSCPLRFGAPSNQLVFSRAELSRPLALADPELLETLEEFVRVRLARLSDGGGFATRVRRWLGETLPRGEKPSLARLAQELGVGQRQLQIRLKEEDTSYQKLLDQVREQIALGYLKKGEVTLCELALLLGFSEQSAFNHAFKRWTGSPPREFLQRPQQDS
ncbi:MAG: AraC family transcriptional regulator [bacterium]|nr:AraC family transcriptional regulator [bacterium]